MFCKNTFLKLNNPNKLVGFDLVMYYPLFMRYLTVIYPAVTGHSHLEQFLGRQVTYWYVFERWGVTEMNPNETQREHMMKLHTEIRINPGTLKL